MTKKELEQLKDFEKQGFFTCFRTGVWPDSKGKSHDITQGDLETIVNQFDQITQKGKEVPILIGHPENDEPEQGKIQNLIKFGDYLLAKAKEIKTNLADQVKKGLLKFVSIAMNPGFELQHIGVTNQPAVDGLLPITKAFASFSKEDIVYTFESSKLLTPFEKEALITKAGLEYINTVLKQLIGIETQEDNPENKNIANQFTTNINQSKKEEPMKDEDTGKEVPGTQEDKTAEYQAKLAAFEQAKTAAENKAKEAFTQLEEMKKQTERNEMAAFTKQLLEKKKLYPNEVEPMTEFLLQQNNQETYQFSKDAEKQTPLLFIKKFLENLPNRLPLDKIQEPQKKTGQDSACFSRIKPSDENLDLHHRAKALMESQQISYEEALARLED